MVDGLNRLGQTATDDGMRLCYHHHMGTGVQTREEVDRLMADTDPAHVHLLFDTGHLYWSGDDPLELAKAHGDRIKHVHLKDIRRAVMEDCDARGLPFLDAGQGGSLHRPGRRRHRLQADLPGARRRRLRGLADRRGRAGRRQGAPAHLRDEGARVPARGNRPVSGEPRFEPQLVDGDIQDGYWIQAVDIDGDGVPDLVTSGLGAGEVCWYQNPGWKRRLIHRFSRPVAMDQGDIAGDGRRDFVICHDYARTMFEATPADGKISWLRNPGSFEGRRRVGGPLHRAARLDPPPPPRQLHRPGAAAGAGGPGRRAEGRRGGTARADPRAALPPPGRRAGGRGVEGRGGGRSRLPRDPRDGGRPLRRARHSGRDAALFASEEGLSWFGAGEDGRGAWRRWARASSARLPTPATRAAPTSGSGRWAATRTRSSQPSSPSTGMCSPSTSPRATAT